MRNRRHFHGHVEVFQCNIPVAFTKWSFRFQHVGVYQTLNHDLRIGRHFKIDGYGLSRSHGNTCQRTRHSDLILIDSQFLGTRVGDHWGGSQ